MAPHEPGKSARGHPLVPKHVWNPRNGYKDFRELELRDPMTQIAHFLEDVGFEKTLLALKSEASEKDVDVDVELLRKSTRSSDVYHRSSLMQVWDAVIFETDDEGSRTRAFQTLADLEGRLAANDQQIGGSMVDLQAKEADDDNSDEGSDSSDDAPARAGQKRKRIMTPSSSDESSSDSDSESDDKKMKDVPVDTSGSDSDSDSDSSEDDDRPLTKRTKLAHTADDDDVPSPELLKKKKKAAKKPAKEKDSSSSDSDSDSDSSSDSSSHSARSAKSKSSSGSSSSSSGSSSSSSSGSSSSSSSDSDSDSGSSSGSSSSGSSSSSSSDSDSDSSSSSSSPSPKKAKKLKKIKTKAKSVQVEPNRSGSTSSSATLVGDKDLKVEKPETDILLVPDSTTNIGTKSVPATKENVKQLKKDHVPFSRIPTSQKIDPKFSSNNYVSYDYADRAYQDLSVTKGKGFTKEKNKKKRGAYHGGAIDLTPKAIKFDD